MTIYESHKLDAVTLIQWIINKIERAGIPSAINLINGLVDSLTYIGCIILCVLGLGITTL